MNYLLPRYSTDIGTPVRVLKSLLEYDQFDDWLPDPVYYTDSLNAIQSVSARIENAWRDGAIQAYESSSIELPRSRGSPLLARKLPLEVRAAAHIVAAQLGPRLVKALPRDKVYGFRWLAGGPRVFDPPGQELRELFRLISRATAYTGKAAALIDVQGFNSAVLVEKFEAILKSIGARPDEAQFLLSLARTGDVGVASIDDAFAFIYNFYLSSVDQNLASRRMNFFRYRDEYFVFDEASKAAVIEGLAGLGLKPRPAQTFAVDTPPRVNRGESGEIELFRTSKGILYGSLDCKQGDYEHCSDWAEISFRQIDYPLEKLFELDPNTFHDAVYLSPLLRKFHRARSGSELELPPFNSDTMDQRSYRHTISGGRAWFLKVIRAAASKSHWWQATWAATALSDIGRLNTEEELILLDLLHTSSVPIELAETIWIALARSSHLSASSYLPTTPPKILQSARGYLVASRLAAKKEPGVWPAALRKMPYSELILKTHLELSTRIK